jgi:hypothetical protein
MRLAVILLLAGCADVECGWVRVGEDSGDPGAGHCARLEVSGNARITKASEGGCSADGSTCVVLMPGESAAAWKPALESNETVMAASHEREALGTDGSCPLSCE